MELFQYKKGYRYNSDTLWLYDFIAHNAPKGELLDVGTGCGILGLLLKRDFPSLGLHGCERQEAYATLSHANATHNGIAYESFTCKDFIEASFDQRFDLICTNPPFYREGSVKSDDPLLVLSRYATALPLEKLIQKASKLLAPRGYLYLCYDAKQSEALLHHLHVTGLRVEAMRFVHAKPDQAAALLLLKARKSSKSLCYVLPPLVVIDHGEHTLEAKRIFAAANTQSLPWPH